MKRLLAVITLLCFAPLSAQAWWNPEWTIRKRITLDTSALAAQAPEAATAVPVAVRLHSGNFLFTDAKPDGADLRFVAGDDKTPLKHHVELFDSANQLAIVWVQVPRVAAQAAGEHLWMYSGNAKAAAAEDAKGVYAPAQRLRLNFSEKDGAFKDASPYANLVAANGVSAAATGVAGGSALFSGKPLSVKLVDSARIAPGQGGAGLAWSAWVKAAAAQKARLLTWGPLTIDLDSARVSAALDRVKVSADGLAPGAWHHLAVTLSDRLVVLVDGKEVAAQPAKAVDLGNELVVGNGFNGELDMLEVVAGPPAPIWFQLQAAQGAEGRLLVYGDAEQDAGSGGDEHGGYIGVLMGSLTVDAKVVIVILSFMFALAAWVMIGKSIMVSRVDRHNGKFLAAFEGQPGRYLDLATDESRRMRNGGAPAHSSLARLYGTGMRELERRVGAGQAPSGGSELSAGAVAAIKASIDSTLIRENQKLNRMMVLLTIAISGGPFLGLLGTVVGVMITFAAIAATGDVNINSIAPGIAAALLATVAGLGVAIPSLFGYNYLITRIKNITADMQAFTDEFVTRLAEVHTQ